MKSFAPIVKHSLAYNPSIDGLRGISISLVLFFHVWPECFSYGYVGVDIFFVLSGYLITQIIYTRLEADTFSIKEFYRNRIRRIFPALIVVLSSAMLLGYLFMFPSEFEQLGNHIKSSAFFYENFRLIHEVGYWDESAILKPLLHFWSLAIEEQFYIFWPLVLMVLYKTRINVALSLSILFLILFVAPFVLELDKFYHFLSRAWELSLGGLAFVVSYNNKTTNGLLDKYRAIIYLLFFSSIVISYGNTAFSSWKTFLVVFASALLILSLSQHKDKTIFSNSILVFIGLISFPLYLWHYVLISFAHIFNYNVQSVGLQLILASFVLSYLTYRYIEIYARAKNSYRFALGLSVLVLALGSLGSYICKKDGLPNRTHLATNKNFEEQFIRTEAKNDFGVSLLSEALGYRPTNDYVKSTSKDASRKFVLVMGDSHAHTSYSGFAEELKKYGYETILLANSSCPPYLGGAMGKNLKDLNECKIKIDNIYKLLSSKLNIEKVILSTRMAYMYDIGFGVIDGGDKPYNYHYESFFTNKNDYDQKQNFFKVVEETFSYFENNHKQKFYYLIENPELGFSPRNYMARPFGLSGGSYMLALESYLNRAGEYRGFIYTLSKKYKKANILDPKNLYCDDRYCYAVKNGIMLYADDDHHSVAGSLEQARYFIDRVIDGGRNDAK